MLFFELGLFFLQLRKILPHLAGPKPTGNAFWVLPEYVRGREDVYPKKLRNFHLHRRHWLVFLFLQFYKKYNFPYRVSQNKIFSISCFATSIFENFILFHSIIC